MLEALYQYAVERGLVVSPGLRRAKPKAYISITSAGDFVSIDSASQLDVYPDVGSNFLCNVLLEKRFITLQEDSDDDGRMSDKKKVMYREAIKDGAEHCASVRPIEAALSRPDSVDAIKKALDEVKIKPKETVSWKVDGIPISKRIDDWRDWWLAYRKKMRGEEEEQPMGTPQRCLITGELCIPARTAGKVARGLQSVGGQSSGSMLISFDKDAYTSYGLKQAGNAAVSEAAMVAVNAALEELTTKAPIMAGTKICVWYDGEGEFDDPMALLGFQSLSGVTKEEKDEAEAEVRRILQSYRTGEVRGILPQTYHILQVSGSSSRVMVRGYEQGKFSNLQNNILAWFNDLSIVDFCGKGMAPYPRMSQILFRLLAPGNSTKPIVERCATELSGMEASFVDAIIHGTRLPDILAPKALAYIRSKIVTGDNTSPDTVACQILKAWLLRRNKGVIDMDSEKKFANKSVAFHCGRLLAVYSAIQRAASKNQNTSVLQRYYTATAAHPARTLSALAQGATHQLPKLSEGRYIFYSNKLAGIAAEIGERDIPQTLTVSEQAEFVLGMYEEQAALYTSTKGSDKDAAHVHEDDCEELAV